MIEVKLSKKVNDVLNKELQVYADGMEQNSHKYWEQNRRASKAYEDSLTGKKGEFLVAEYIKKEHGLSILPDVNIYASRKKNWEADLPYATREMGLADCHVKTCSQKTLDYAKTYSWTFQLSNGNGRHGTDRLLSSDTYDDDLIALVFVPTWESNVGQIMSLSKWRNVKDLLRDPISPRLKGLKACIYIEDVNRKEAKELKKNA
jgi:hypothetical protein